MAAALGITLRVAAEIYGGGRSALNTFPADIQPVPLVSDPTDISMVPNQAVVTEPASTAIQPGDRIDYHLRQRGRSV